MYCKAGDEWDPKVRANKPTMDAVLKPFLRAIETCPKPRDGRQEPILEPHYKLVSIVHKFVLFAALPPQAGADLLQQQPYAINKGEAVTIHTDDEWESFILSHLRALRAVDKQHWQHRMVARVAAIIHDENEQDWTTAAAACEIYQNSIFTKTMSVTVWKPEAERPGRHCVYMERYVKLMIKLLWMTDDKDNMELLAKRIRKKPLDYFRFNQVWNECCTMYLRLIRRKFDIQGTMDEAFRTVPAEEFEILTERLQKWLLDPTVSHPALDALKEVSELKKLNANLMKTAPIDDLINDAYGTLYTQVGKTLGAPVVLSLDGESPAPHSRLTGPMSLDNLVLDMNGTQIPVPVTIAAMEPRTRKVGISRREVLRQAELIVQKVAELGAVRAMMQRALPEPTSILGSNDRVSESVGTPKVDGDEEGEEEEGEDEEGEGDVEGEGEREGGNAGAAGNNEFADDADDESGSDLSDVPDMDDVDEESIFPGMH